MTENRLNIFDLMQGSPNKAAAGQLVSLELIGQTDVHNVEQQATSFDMIFGNMLATLSPKQTGQTEALLQNSQLSLLGSQGNTEQMIVDENIVAFNKELDGLALKNMSLQNINIKEILSQQGQELESGQFKVLSKEIVDSQVALTIESSNGKQLTISLPIEALQNQNGKGMQERVQLQNSNVTKELELLIEKVNISQIEIKSSDAKVSQSGLKPVEISLVGEQNSAVVTLKASLKKNQIKLNELQTTSSHQKAAVLDESGLFDEKVVVKQNQSNKLIEKVTIDSNQQNPTGSLKLNQQMISKEGAITQSVERTDSVMYSYNTDKVDNAELKENIQNIRMQLPENIKSVLRPNGQAIVIKMNPENLGPAKLSLSFSGGELRAKLIVSSFNAKQMLDGSMNRLVDQLQKIDINIDKIDVILDENQNQNEQFNQKQQWQRKMSQKNIDLEQFEQNELEQTVSQPMVSVLQQVSSGSVNFLA